MFDFGPWFRFSRLVVRALRAPDGKRSSERSSRKFPISGVLSLVAAIILAMSAPTAARSQTVITDCDTGTFQNALNKGGLITFADDCELITLNALNVTKNVTIDGSGYTVVIDGNHMAKALLNLGLGVTLAVNRVTFQNSGDGGGEFSAILGGTLTFTNCAFLNNSGGAIQAGSGSLTVLNTTFSGNSGSRGAIFSAAPVTTIINSTFSGNSTSAGGAIQIAGGAASLINTVFAQNAGGNCGGSVHDGGYNLSDDGTCGFSALGSKNSDLNINLGSLTNGVIPPNPGSDAVDYIPAGTNGCATTVTTDQIGQARPGSLDGKCTVGAYEVVAPVSATIKDCADDMQLQSAVSSGGRIVFACSGDIPLSKTLNISQNTALDGTGQIVTLDGHNAVQVLLVNSEVSLSLNVLTISGGNSGTATGGGAKNLGTLILTNSTFSGNSTSTNDGGGVYNDLGTLVIANSTLSGNSAHGGGSGGGVFNLSGTLIVSNSTFFGNTAPDGAANGGAIYNLKGGLTVANSTFSANSSVAVGGGIYLGKASATLRNNLFVNNGGGNCEADNQITDEGYNLDDDGTCGFSSPTSLSNNKTANLGTLSNNGGPTLTVPLLSGSAAIDAIPLLANGCGITILTDQRGVWRPQGPGCDIGASENALNQVQVTFNTNPGTLSYTAGPASYGTQQVLTLPVGTQSTVWTASPQTSPGTQYNFKNWSDGGAQAHIIRIPGSNSTYTANFNTSYLLTIAVNPSGAGTVTPPSGQYYPAGSQAPLKATPNSGYGFSVWTGTFATLNNPLTVTMNSPVTETANFVPTLQVTVGTNPVGLSFSVDGTTYSSTQALAWVPGSQHTITTTSPQLFTGLQYGFANWSDGGAISHQVIASTATISYTANFNSFTITPNPPAETVNRGNIAAFILTLKSVNGFSGNVKLSCSGGPAGSYCVDFPMTTRLNGTAYAISGILFPKNTTPGVYTVTFTGVSGTLSNTATAKFTVK